MPMHGGGGGGGGVKWRSGGSGQGDAERRGSVQERREPRYLTDNVIIVSQCTGMRDVRRGVAQFPYIWVGALSDGGQREIIIVLLRRWPVLTAGGGGGERRGRGGGRTGQDEKRFTTKGGEKEGREERKERRNSRTNRGKKGQMVGIEERRGGGESMKAALVESSQLLFVFRQTGKKNRQISESVMQQSFIF